MRKKKETCVDCGRELTKDEIALNKKLISLDLMELFRMLECIFWLRGRRFENKDR